MDLNLSHPNGKLSNDRLPPQQTALAPPPRRPPERLLNACDLSGEGALVDAEWAARDAVTQSARDSFGGMINLINTFISHNKV